MPRLMVMCGLPCAGKTTLIEDMQLSKEWKVIGTNQLREQYELTFGLSFKNTFSKGISAIIENQFYRQIDDAIAAKINVIIDQTNLTRGKRAKILDTFEGYEKWCVYVDTPTGICWSRNQSLRVERQTPYTIFHHMENIMIPPTLSEGFDKVETVKF